MSVYFCRLDFDGANSVARFRLGWAFSGLATAGSTPVKVHVEVGEVCSGVELICALVGASF